MSCVHACVCCLPRPREDSDNRDGPTLPSGVDGVCDLIDGVCAVLSAPFVQHKQGSGTDAAAGSSGGKGTRSAADPPSLLATVQHTMFRVSAVRLRGAVVVGR